MARYDNDWWKQPLTECPICKKKFAPAPEHYWKIGNANNRHLDSENRVHLVCSYTCMRVWEKKIEAKSSNKPANDWRVNAEAIRNHRIDAESREARNLKIKQMADEGCSIKEIAVEFGITSTRVCQILRKF